MNAHKLILAKREMRRTYKRLTGLRDDKSVTIADLASLFNISIPIDRISDFRLVDFNEQEMKIEIEDTKYDATYRGIYSKNSDLLFISGDGDVFIDTSIIHKNIQRFSTYCVSDKKVLKDVLVLNDGLDEVQLAVTVPINNHPTLKRKIVSIKLAKGSFETPDYRNSEVLYHRIKIQQLVKNRVITYLRYNVGDKTLNRINRYRYEFDNNLICGLENGRTDLDDTIISGFVIQNSGNRSIEYLNQFLPSQCLINNDEKETLTKDTQGVIRFLVAKNDEQYILTIVKTSDCYKIYTKRKLSDMGEFNQGDYAISHQNKNSINCDDIESITVALKSILSEENFSQVIMNELKEFSNQMKSVGNNDSYHTSITDPSLYFDMPFCKLERLFVENKQNFFDTMFSEMQDIEQGCKTNQDYTKKRQPLEKPTITSEENK